MSCLHSSRFLPYPYGFGRIFIPDAEADKTLNLVLSGGGVKGIAFVGAIEAVEKKGYRWGNIAGVSAGAVAGSFLGAGYKADELKKVMDEFDFGSIELNETSRKLSSLYRFPQLCNDPLTYRGMGIEDFIRRMALYKRGNGIKFYEEFPLNRSGLIDNIISFSKESYILDGDGLEEWVWKVLHSKGIETFGDLRGGIADKANPKGYKVRMTTVDANRKKVVVIPDDMDFYGIDPDSFSVAKAVRMSTCVPFAFKPVELEFTQDNAPKTHSFIDGGVFDNFPFWLIENVKHPVKIGFRLDGGVKKKFLSLETPLSILKSLISSVHDIGVPKKAYNLGYVARINTTKVSFLDFKLSSEEKEYLFKSGKRTSTFFINNLERMGILGAKWRRRGPRVF